MDGAVAERGGEGVIDAAVLVEQRQAVEGRSHDGHLEVIARSRPILDGQLVGVGKRLLEQRADGLGVHCGHRSWAGYPAGVRFLRAVLLFKLGFWAGILASAALMKRMFPSRGDADSDEVALVAIFDGIELESRSTAFRGGSMFSWFGGIAVDLRGATLAPDARLTVNALWGGVAIRVPPHWRVESNAHALGGGVAISSALTKYPDAPRLSIDGFALLGGIAVGAKAADTEPES